jgi:putative pyrroloquinoline-quinone binding quinoprotein
VRPLGSTCLIIVALVATSASQAAALRTVFKFSAGATLFAPPGVGQDGSLYVGSGDGYVHALWADGSFRWSYTVKGRVLAPPVEEAGSGRVFVVTSEARLYALESDSHLRWVFPLPIAPKTELVLTPKGTLLFVGQDDYLYGITTGGALSLRLAATGARSAPALLLGGQVGVLLGDSLATLKGYGYERVALSGPFAASAKLALDANRAIFACEDGVARVVGARTELDVESDCASPPVRGDGFFAVAEAGGDVRLLFNDGSSERIPLGAAALRPSWDAARRRLIVSTATGSVSAVELTGGSP